MAGRRGKALVLLIIAVVAVIAFGVGVTMCIDWGDASTPPDAFLQPGVIGLWRF